jgi:hypothetical protein
VDRECIKHNNDYDYTYFIENGCFSEFSASGQCISDDYTTFDWYNSIYQEIILKYNYVKELEPIQICGGFTKSIIITNGSWFGKKL